MMSEMRSVAGIDIRIQKYALVFGVEFMYATLLDRGFINQGYGSI